MASNKKLMSPEQLGDLVQLIRDSIDLASCNSFLEGGHSNLKENDQGEPVEILPHLYLGSSYHASSKRILDKLGVTALLNVSRGCPNYFEDSYEYKCIPVEDSSSEEISVWFDEAIDFIDAVKKSNGKVLVHCRAGISRSATICMAYLMVTKRLRMEEAYEYVKSRRKVISPNFNFMGQLLSFEAKLFAAKDFFSLEECVSSSSVLASL